MALTLEFPDGSLPTAQEIADTLLATVNGPETVAEQLQDAATSSGGGTTTQPDYGGTLT